MQIVKEYIKLSSFMDGKSLKLCKMIVNNAYHSMSKYADPSIVFNDTCMFLCVITSSLRLNGRVQFLDHTITV